MKNDSRWQVILKVMKAPFDVSPDLVPPSVRQRFGIGNKTGQYLDFGGYGYAVRYGDKVLKVTGDDLEALASLKIVNKSSKNVAKIFQVKRREYRFRREQAWDKFSDQTFYIWQKYYEMPTEAMTTAAWIFGDLVIHFQVKSKNTTAKKIAATISAFKKVLYDEIGFSSDYEATWDKIERRVKRTSNGEILRIALTNFQLFSPVDAAGDKGYADEVMFALKGLMNANKFLRNNGVVYKDYHGGNVRRSGKNIVVIDLGRSTVDDPGQPEVLAGLARRFIERLR